MIIIDFLLLTYVGDCDELLKRTLFTIQTYNCTSST